MYWEDRSGPAPLNVLVLYRSTVVEFAMASSLIVHCPDKQLMKIYNGSIIAAGENPYASLSNRPASICENDSNKCPHPW
jgi:hypothetical protein